MRRLVLAIGLLGCERAAETDPDPAPGPRRLAIDAPAPDARSPPDAATVGPVDVMAELTAILDPKIGGHYDAAKLANQRFPYRADWDPRHAWLLAADQIGQRVTIRYGTAAPEDATELLERLAVDVYFEDVIATSGERQSDGSWVNTLDLRVPGAEPNAMAGYRGHK